MADKSESPNLSILHVLTLNGRNGEYGGPVRVAREICTELNARGFETHIFSGAIQGSDPVSKVGLSESFVHVKPLTEKFRVSSLWSWKLLKPLNQLIRKSDFVHIHFARDLIPFLACLLAILNKKPFVAQTHGMILSDGRTSTRAIDLLLTRPLISKSKKILVLTASEMKEAKRLNLKAGLQILPNGISVEKGIFQQRNKIKRVVFCSRLEKRKGVDKFLELAARFRSEDILFEIYGPDGGELGKVQNEISRLNIQDKVRYMGSLPSGEVQMKLREIDLLVLPSADEPFPMIILETLSVGRPVIVMPSCGISRVLADYNFNFVARDESSEGIYEPFMHWINQDTTLHERIDIQQFAFNEFDISLVVNSLELVYFVENPN